MRPDRRQRGATAVEFALALLLFFTFVLGIVDFSRMVFTWSAASEAARMGARYATVCDNKLNADKVLAKMQAMLPQIATIDVQWLWDQPGPCTVNTCTGVQVRITNLDYQWISPIAGMASRAISMPTFSTYLPREVMRQDSNSDLMC